MAVLGLSIPGALSKAAQTPPMHRKCVRRQACKAPCRNVFFDDAYLNQNTAYKFANLMFEYAVILANGMKSGSLYKSPSQYYKQGNTADTMLRADYCQYLVDAR